MTRLRWRISAVASGFVLATLLLVGGGASVSAGPGTMIWTGSYWKDPVCGSGNELFVARIWTNANYTGTSWKFCSAYSDLCYVSHGQDSSDALLCSQGYDAGTANDYASSIKISSIGGGASCSLRWYDNRNYGGAQWVQWDPINDSNLGPTWPNDVWSSVRRVCT